MNRIRIGCGAGFAGDRIAPAVDLVRDGRLDYLALECLGERTVALAQARRLRDPSAGADPLLAKRIRALAGPLAGTGARLVTNAGAADPEAAARLVARVSAEAGAPMDAAAVVGDDVLDRIDLDQPAWEDGRPLGEHGEIVSANAYVGADALLPALETGARAVVCGRAADPSLFLAPMMHAFGWASDDWDILARGTAVGHLLECAGQLTGGYFADPPYKTVPGLARLGYPLGEVAPDGSAVVTKLPGAGGVVDTRTVAEQLAYEVTDPAAYLTPDVAADFTAVRADRVGPDRVEVRGAAGRPRPDALKVSVGYRAGFRGEGEIGYAGRGAVRRARLAGEVVRERLGGAVRDLRIEVVGVDAMHGPREREGAEPYECRLRVAGRSQEREAAEAVAEEVEALYTSGPAGGGGVRVRVDEVVGVLSAGIPRDAVETAVVRVAGRAPESPTEAEEG
ncbi:acyclic terpene utilization AtuA family protein [Nocardiopsis chromatogenes]|uniref:acyclic terpene utilization AtuA family protein n=1 Tax=Nocardiopsis chromatogenes TaxID=280239 RepID=UPI000349A315|nr:acyclic terpene utilization AtuA family protein [Nocardiopsis chromatogenes]